MVRNEVQHPYSPKLFLLQHQSVLESAKYTISFQKKRVTNRERRSEGVHELSAIVLRCP